MAATKVAIIYSIAQRRRRVVVVPNNDSELDLLAVQLGEKLITQGILAYRTIGPDFAVRQDSGGFPRPDRCAVIHNTLLRVIHHICADPTIDSINNHTLVQSDVSKPGDLWRPLLRKFARRYVTVDIATRTVTGFTLGDPENPPVDTLAAVQRESDTLNVGDLLLANEISGTP